MTQKRYCIGVDYGTDSVRSIIVDAATGEELAWSVYRYPRWEQGLYCDAATSQFRQHPLDYLEGLEHTVKSCILTVGADVAANICAIGIDTTGSTPIAVDEKGVPLSLYPEFENDPDAMFMLWKDHTSIKEMNDINEHAKRFSTNYLKYVGDIYSSEWFWAKLLNVFRNNAKVRAACYTWVEHCDLMPFILTGGTHASQIKRSICASGHKGLFAKEWNGFPPEEFVSTLDPLLGGFVSTLPSQAYTADMSAGNLCALWAEKLGLSTEVIVGIGALDAHIGAVGGQIESYNLSMVMGTSTCDMLVVPTAQLSGQLVPGICGSVDGSIIPGMVGMEAGQSAFGDVYAWFKKLLEWSLNLPSSADLSAQTIAVQSSRIMEELNRQASALPFDVNSELCIDWFNGRRTPDANQMLKGAICGLDLGSDAPQIFRSLVESTCFGAKAIVDRFDEYSIQIKGVIALGGIAHKSPFVMQTMADILNMPIKVNASTQTCALGAAMFAATAAGIYGDVEQAMQSMGHGFSKTYTPQTDKVDVYAKRYTKYCDLGDFLAKKVFNNKK